MDGKGAMGWWNSAAWEIYAYVQETKTLRPKIERYWDETRRREMEREESGEERTRQGDETKADVITNHERQKLRSRGRRIAWHRE